MNKNEIFHVHTYRCGHAEMIEDEAYVKVAIELGAERIVFTDHTPFTGDPFTNRMKMDELNDYTVFIQNLMVQYERQIQVRCGLEIEYLPSYEDDIAYFRRHKDIDILLLGQHHYEVSPGVWSFQKRDPDNEWKGLVKAMIQGINTGLFDVVAHPDRAFRSQKIWTDEMNEAAKTLIRCAMENDTVLEKNIASMHQDNAYRDEFWKLVPDDCDVIVGLDAHSIEDLIQYFRESQNIR